MNLWYYFPKCLTSRSLLLRFFQMYTCIQQTSVIFSSCSPLSLFPLTETLLPSKTPSYFPVSLVGVTHWVHLQWPTGSGLQRELDSGPLCEQCQLFTTEPCLLHQVKCLKCHRGSAAGWFCVHLRTGRLHILCQEPLTCLLLRPKWAPHSAVCLWVNSTMIKRGKHLVVGFIFLLLDADVFLSRSFS